ncbi:hypothetical protein UlMin_009313 [Ulmus minor]
MLRAVTLLVLVASMEVSLALAAVYKVGDSAGWTSIGNVDYKLWAATKSFEVGDIIHFEYSPQFHNVMRLTHAMYRACNVSMPMETYTSGNDTITIKTRGHHFFVCGVPGHCQSGQKVDINVPRSLSSAPSPAALLSPSVPAIKAPSPASNVAAPSNNSLKTHILLFGLATAIFLVFGFSIV